MIDKGISQISHAQRRQLLRERLTKGRLVVAPGVFEMVSAKIADRMGFEALYMTGYGTVASYLGLPDAGLATYTDMVNRVSQFTRITQTPFICDGDTGYGGLLNVMHTVRGYEAAGAVAIQLEDQEFPKKCGHMLGRRVIAAEDMVAGDRVVARDGPGPVVGSAAKRELVVPRSGAPQRIGGEEVGRTAPVPASRCATTVRRPEFMISDELCVCAAASPRPRTSSTHCKTSTIASAIRTAMVRA